jgi:murein DD-endopeptidase MepM/ murein hydrolase activator NlpD
LQTQYIEANGEIEHSLFVAGQKAGLSDRLVLDLVAIFAWDIDFALDIQPGDRFTVVYEKYFYKGKKVKNGTIVAAAFANNGHIYRALRYTDPTGVTAYYTPEGDSMQKAFLRTPVKIGRISSHFSLARKHPILNIIRAHKGVDYAAPIGTPVYATGSGKVQFKGWKGGYGKTIALTHGDTYSTLYGHLSDYAENLSLGQHVSQGDVIGYIGNTGLATGPHLHYEFRVNNVHKNPLTVKLPKAKPLPEEYQADFRDKNATHFATLEKIDGSATVATSTFLRKNDL